MDVIERVWKERFKILGSEKPKRSESTLAGMPCRHLSWNLLGHRVEADLVVRDKTFYALVTYATGAEGEASFEPVRAGFKFID